MPWVKPIPATLSHRRRLRWTARGRGDLQTALGLIDRYARQPANGADRLFTGWSRLQS
jgi:succinate dehydrogenase flavin-adding protein (antitoxin of CptAB toxin-antitoxin module)